MKNNIGLYVHVPFCVRKCPYCDFYSIKYDKKLEDEYAKAIIADMLSYKGKGITADTLYFGGGTPILMSSKNIKAIIDIAKEVFSLDGEITLEANPNSTSQKKLLKLKNAGINRISFGVQSADEKELKALGRLHDLPQAINAVNQAYEAGINNISVDIMLGTPYQTMDSVNNTIDILTKLPISHISAYMLKVEKGTPYYNNDILKYCADEDELADIYLNTIDKLENKGFYQYEISNFSKKGLESKHNLKYWQCEEYLGFGASAHSFINERRYYNENSVKEYIESKGKNSITTDDSAGGVDEYILLGLRLTKGIDLQRLKQVDKFNFDYNKFMSCAYKFVDKKFCIINDQALSLTKKGFLISNYIISELLDNY